MPPDTMSSPLETGMRSAARLKRWLWLPVMIPLMWGWMRLVSDADRLYGWLYSEDIAPPTSADYRHAAVVFWGALLTPLVIGVVAAVVAFRQQHTARWPLTEAAITIVPLLALVAGVTGSPPGSGPVGQLVEAVLVGAHLLVGGGIVVALANVGACARHRRWGRLTLSGFVSSLGLLYLFWLYAFIIYINT